MSALRSLALCFLVSAAAFGLAAGLQTHPHLRQDLARLTRDFDAGVWRPALARASALSAALLAPPLSDARVVLELAPATPAEERAAARVELPPIERPGIMARDLPDGPIMIAPTLPALPAPPVREGRGQARPATPPQMAQTPRAMDQALTREQAHARARLTANLSPEMRRNFDLFLFVSKAVEGPLAQRMYVFKKEDGALRLLYDWAASTGREQQEVNARGAPSHTGTPPGFYQLDPARMYARYRSWSWDQPMPYAMFFNWRRQGIQTGLAIHAAEGTDKLGMRASAGCVQLSPQNARTLFDLVRADYRGQVPRFSVDASDTMSNRGRFARSADGSLRMASGYRVLINIENYSGLGDDKMSDVIF